MLLVCSSLGLGTIFCGFGIQKTITENYEISSLLAKNSTQLLLSLYAPLGIVSTFMIIILLLYYMRCSMTNYELFLTLGMDKSIYYFVRVMEGGVGFLFIGLIGIVFGHIILRLTVFALGKWTDLALSIPKLGIDVYSKSLSIICVIFIFSCMATRDLWWGFQMGNSVNKQDIQERMPMRFLKMCISVGSILCLIQIYRYSKIYNFESIWILGLFFVGVFLLFRYGIAAAFQRQQRSIRYLYKLLEHSRMRNRSLTNTGYLYVLMIMQFSVMFLFSFQIVATMLAEDSEELYPYDIVCIADDGDIDFFREMQEEYKVDIESYPMVRVSNYDTTEAIEAPGQKTIQGQHIGISESVYHVLKKNINANYKEKDLGLDAEGKDIYIVHQQDKAMKARPTDFWLHSKTPLLHVGQPCAKLSSEMALTANISDVGYYFKDIKGEEIGSLIGTFGQGIKENIIVFSDEYFLEAQKFWKTRNIYTGKEITNPKERILDITIKQGPTKLILINGVRKTDMHKIKKMMEVYRERHTYDEKYDRSVKPYYLKWDEANRLMLERIIKLTMNVFMIFYFFLMSVFLISVKLLTEQRENRERNQFLRCMGMEWSERRRVLFVENYKFFYVPAVTGMISALIFVTVVFLARMYPLEIRLSCLKYLVLFWGSYIFVFGIVVWVILFFYIRILKGE